MIKFALQCENDHDFEAWFKNNEDYETQQKRGLMSCPVCHSTKIGKTLMAPSVSTGRKKDAIVASGLNMQAEMLKALREMTKHVKANAENVGDKFAEEAKKIHYGEAESRGIFGNASQEQVQDLVSEGIEIMPLPDLPDELN